MNKKEEYIRYIESLPKKIIASGTIIRDRDKRILMVKPSYKPTLEIPGGVVEKNESPYEACKREVLEELGIKIAIERMLCVDYSQPKENKPERLLFIYYGGVLSTDRIEEIKVDGTEILSFEFMTLEEIKGKTTDSLYGRVKMSIEAIEKQTTYYLENQNLIR